ncbi:MAG: hypothetical protein ABI560_11775 [Myxococcales bacterium]
MNSARCPWFVGLALAIIVIVGAQIRAPGSDDAELASSGDDVTFSILDDGFVALPCTPPLVPSCPPARAFLSFSGFPPGRLVIPDLFRPPTSPSV